MSLISCPECASEISDKAPSCPKCGVPISAENIATESNLVTTQETSKVLKIQIGLSAAITFLGLWAIYATPARSDARGFAIFVTVVGVVWFIVSKVRAWWHHG